MIIPTLLKCVTAEMDTSSAADHDDFSFSVNVKTRLFENKNFASDMWSGVILKLKDDNKRK